MFGNDASLGITIGDAPARHSDADYRALIYVNGWNAGKYIANVGPQHTFVVPNGILDPAGYSWATIRSVTTCRASSPKLQVADRAQAIVRAREAGMG